MRYMFLRFPEGRLKAVTLSYDDGVRDDIRFAEILNAHGMKGTFNINSSSIGREGKLTAEEIDKYLLSCGHEVAVHGEFHMAPGIVTPAQCMTDVLNCRKALEDTFGRIIRGMAYPDSGITKMHNGNDYEKIRTYLEGAGIVYSRTLNGDNDSFLLPNDWYAWMPTAHHNNANLMKWTEEFLQFKDENIYLTRRYPRLFYLWGHSYEFERDNNRELIEQFCREVAGKDDVWYATNGEIYDYVTAYQSLVMSADTNRIYNPTLKEIWFMADHVNYHIAPGEEIVIGG